VTEKSSDDRKVVFVILGVVFSIILICIGIYLMIFFNSIEPDTEVCILFTNSCVVGGDPLLSIIPLVILGIGILFLILSVLRMEFCKNIANKMRSISFKDSKEPFEEYRIKQLYPGFEWGNKYHVLGIFTIIIKIAAISAFIGGIFLVINGLQQQHPDITTIFLLPLGFLLIVGSIALYAYSEVLQILIAVENNTRIAKNVAYIIAEKLEGEQEKK